jgi:hypothetical protein
MTVRIEPFRREHAAAFDGLNRDCLVKHNLLEPPDEGGGVSALCP